MKSFFASFFGALTALVVFVFGGMFLMFVGIVMLAALGEQQPPQQHVEKGSFLVLDLNTNLTDAPSPFEGGGKLAGLLGADGNRLQLRLVLEALQRAQADGRIRGLLLTGNLQPQDYGSGYAALREVRRAVEAFRSSGKPVVAYAENLDTRNYYLMSAASEVVLHPFGLVWMPGLASEPVFLAGTLEKLGVGVQVTRSGRYKSYAETYVRRDFSPEAREATQKLLDDVWSELRAEVAQSRKLAPEQLQALVEQPQAQVGAVAVENGLVDRTAYWDEVLADLKARTDAEDEHTFKQVGLRAYVKALAPRHHTGGTIAVVYAEGVIVDGEGQEEGEVGGDRFARELRQLRQDEKVKAVVLRVNSPGGSANASEVIQRELRLLQAQKPVVVSMGSVAASGGYWISAYADRIFAEPSTITGSIGVIGMLFNVKELSQKVGVSFDVVKTGKFADTETLSRPKTEEELRAIQSVVDWLYESFIERVAQGRKLDTARVREIAEGRVWSGSDAKRLGLIDEFGGLEAAIDHAAQRAQLGRTYRLQEYPRKRELGEILQEFFEDSSDYLSRGRIEGRILGRVRREVRALEQYNDPRNVYLRLPVELQLN
ncbi:MAG TPA: signal peptide peptidase SppA [Opitutaceae bacterium]|nr:signal peptide peptidase SppA [Opitutaceae bacterium]